MIRDLLSVVDDERILSLAGGLPDSSMLPNDEVARAVLAVTGSTASSLQYGPTEGEPALRAWIARHELDGVDPASVLVTHGAQQALALVVEALIDPGDVVVVERTSYIGMLQPLGRAGAQVVAVASDEHGMCTDELEELLRSGVRPVLCYVCPTHQNPTGTVMPQERRRHLGELAATYSMVVVDDDPYRDLGPPPPPRLRDVVPERLAVTVGSFSKTVTPGLRVGWVHAPAPLRDAMVRMKQADDLQTATLAQRVLVELLREPGWLDRRTRALTEVYRQRAAALSAALRTRLGGRVSIGPTEGGMFLWATFPGCPVDTDELFHTALERGVAFVPGSAFDPRRRPSRAGRLCCATMGAEQLDLAAARLAAAVDDAWQDRRWS